ncbi:MAG: AraC family transcriptional regulator [Cytophagales bacterium]|nr:AraC family transcriptional regulator [Cytophagales bacterium]
MRDPVVTLRWSTISPVEESMHLASVRILGSGKPAAHRHDFYECFVVESGRGIQDTDDRQFDLRGGSAYFLRPEHAHRLSGSGSVPLMLINIAIEASAAEFVLQRFPFPDAIWRAGQPIAEQALTVRQTASVRELVSLCASGPRDAGIAAWFLLSLRRLLVSRAPDAATQRLPFWLADALPLAGEPGNLRAGLPRLVALCGRTQEHVTRSMKRYLGVSPTQWLKAERIAYARRLIETTHESITQIALECGFESLSYFHRCFRELSGTTPLQMRKRATLLH